jgi:hypothetical protein
MEFIKGGFMFVKQISVFMENRAGRLEEITGILAKSNINIRALSLADTSDFGILRLIVSDPDKATEILKRNAFTVRENDVIAVEVDDKPGGLHEILSLFSKAGISIEYMYAFLERKYEDRAVLIIRVEAAAKAAKMLQDAGKHILVAEETYSM